MASLCVELGKNRLRTGAWLVWDGVGVESVLVLISPLAGAGSKVQSTSITNIQHVLKLKCLELLSGFIGCVGESLVFICL